MKLPVASGKDVVKALSKIEYYVRAIIKEAGLTVEEFLDLLWCK